MTTEEKSIRLAKLGLIEPQEVYEELMKYREALLSSSSSLDWIWSGDEKLEAELLKRDAPLIDLGLAIAANSSSVLKTLWGKYDGKDENLALAIKVGILSGTNASAIAEEELAKVLQGTYVKHYDSDDMAYALMKNQRARHVVEKLLKRQPPFDSISNDRFPVLLHALSKNNCLNVDGSDMESPDLTYWGIRKAIFNVVTEAPVTTSWLYPLYDLLSSIEETYYPKSADEFNFAEFVAKWRDLPDEGRTSIDGYYTNHTLPEEFLCLCACLFGYKVFPTGTELTDKEQADVVYRCAYYSRASLSKSQISKALAKDGSTFVFSALYNDRHLINNETRELVESELTSNLKPLYNKRVQRLNKQGLRFNTHVGQSPEGERDGNSDGLQDTVEALRTSLKVLSVSFNKLKNVVYGVLAFAVVTYFTK
jgi:hypothetical protein